MSDGPAQADYGPAIDKVFVGAVPDIPVGDTSTTQYTFIITYHADGGPAVRIIDTVPNEFDIVSCTESAGTVQKCAKQGTQGKGANRIEWDLPANTDGTLTVVIETSESPGKGRGQRNNPVPNIFKPTDCPDTTVTVNEGAEAFEITGVGGDLVLDMMGNPISVAGPSNSLTVDCA